MPILDYALTALVAYLLGSIPTGFLVAKARGMDIRTVGSGNIGATNVFRILGKTAGAFVLLMDALKGWAAVAIAAPLVAQMVFQARPRSDLRIAAGIAAILGHNYTCWLHFKGGKGIATSAGVLIGLVPWALAIILAIWIILFRAHALRFGRFHLRFIRLPFATWFTTNHDVGLTIVTAVMAALAIYKHRMNIQPADRRHGKPH